MIDHRNVVGATEFANGSSRWMKVAEDGRDVIIAKNNKPTAALVGIDRLQELEDREENIALLALALVRTATDSGTRTSLDDFIAELGLTEAVGAALAEDDEDDEDC